MKKNYKILLNKKLLQQKINALDKNKIHIVYFSYRLNFHNLYHGPLLLATKLLALFTNKPAIDHVAHISRFILDAETGDFEAKIFEATMERGMEQNDLFTKLKSFQGTCYIETLNKEVNKPLAREFEKKYTGVAYSKEMALLSGLDFNLIDKYNKPKNDGGFCSWLESLFLKNQGIDIGNIENGNPLEITPTDIYCAKLGSKSILSK